MLNSLHPRNILPQLDHLACVIQLLGCQLHAEGKLRFAELQQFFVQIRVIFLSQFASFHRLPQVTRNECR